MPRFKILLLSLPLNLGGEARDTSSRVFYGEIDGGLGLILHSAAVEI